MILPTLGLTAGWKKRYTGAYVQVTAVLAWPRPLCHHMATPTLSSPRPPTLSSKLSYLLHYFHRYREQWASVSRHAIALAEDAGGKGAWPLSPDQWSSSVRRGRGANVLLN